MKIGAKSSITDRILHQQHKISFYDLLKKDPQYGERSIYRHAKKNDFQERIICGWMTLQHRPSFFQSGSKDE